jgi:hypothetical protein
MLGVVYALFQLGEVGVKFYYIIDGVAMNTKEEIMKLTTSLPEVGLVELLNFALLIRSKYSDARSGKKSRGGLHKYANPDLIPFEKSVWEKAVVENYAR